MPRLPSRREPPITFAHRGGCAAHPENTLEAFTAALAGGATGLETDAWLTADGQVALHHDRRLGWWPWAPRVGTVCRDDLPGHVPTLADLYRHCGDGFELAIDVKDPAAFDPIVDTARAVGASTEARLWLCHPSFEVVSAWRSRTTVARLVHSSRPSALGCTPERHAARLAEAGIDAVNFHHHHWSGGLVTLYHRFERYALGWDAQFDRVLDELFDAGIDGVFSDHVDRMVARLAARR